MRKLTAILLLALCTSVGAQTPEEHAALNAAHQNYLTLRNDFVAKHTEAIRQLNLAADSQTIATLRADLDAANVAIAASKEREAARVAAATAALAAVSKATTIAGLRTAILPLITELAK